MEPITSTIINRYSYKSIYNKLLAQIIRKGNKTTAEKLLSKNFTPEIRYHIEKLRPCVEFRNKFKKDVILISRVLPMGREYNLATKWLIQEAKKNSLLQEGLLQPPRGDKKKELYKNILKNRITTHYRWN